VRVLVVSDVHGNWPALEAVAAVPHDSVVCLGDIVGYGPQPGECLGPPIERTVEALKAAGIELPAFEALARLLRTGRAGHRG
jgi:hypothetical protein